MNVPKKISISSLWELVSVVLGLDQSRTKRRQAFWPAGGRQERLAGTGNLLPQDFCGKTMQAVTEQPIKKLNFFEFLRVSPGVYLLAKKPEDCGYKIGLRRSPPFWKN